MLAARTWEEFQDKVHLEQQFACMQAAKVLHHYGMEPSWPLKLGTYRENTPVFSYYVLKSMLLWNVAAFDRDVRQRSAYFSLTEQTDVVKFGHFLLSSTDMEDYWDHVQTAYASLVPKAPEYMSMRMTLHETP